MIRSFVCSVYLLAVCVTYPIQANDECLINNDLMDEIPSLNNQTTINAGSIQVLSDSTLELRNGFEIKLEDLHVNGDQAVFNENKKSINEILNGFISGQNYVSKFEKGSINSLADEAVLESGEVLFRNRNIKFEFKELKESTRDKFKIINTSFTSCADTQKGWTVTADEVQLNDESGRGILKNLKVKLFNTTVFGFPVIPFTATDKRTSGFLEPEIAFSSDGWDAYLPIYIVTSEKTDLTFAPRTINDRGNGFELNLRNLSGFNQNNIDVIKINNDKQISKASNKDRWAYAIDHKYDLGKLNMQIEWSKTSDPLVLNDIETNFNKSIDRRTHFLPQKVVVGFPLIGGKFKIHKESYQIINPLFPYELNKSPAVNFSIEKIIGATSYSLNLDSSEFSIDKVPLKFYSTLANANGLLDKFDTGKRNLATAKMKTVLNNKSYIAEIENELIYKDYDQDSGKNYDSSFIKSKITFKKYFSKRDNLKQSNFELLSGFGYTNYRDQSSLPVFDSQFLFGRSHALFSNSRFIGLDRIIDEKYLFIGFKHLLDTQNYRIRTNFGLKERLEPSKVLNKIYGSDSERDIATFNSSFHTNNNLSFDV
jgi:LPS-assembly protein